MEIMKKRIVSMFLAAMMAFSTSAVVVSAENTREENKLNYSCNIQPNDGYFEFKDNDGERMENDGSFIFMFTNGLHSDFFKIQSTELHLEIDGSEYISPGTTYDTYTVALYRTGIPDREVKSEICRVGKDYHFTYTGLNTSYTYYLQFNAIEISPTNARLSGSGRVYNINKK